MPGLSRLRRDERGFTMIELLVTMLVLTVGVFGSVKVFHAAFDGTSGAEDLDQGVVVATQALEQMRAVPYADLALSHNPAMPGGDDDERLRGAGGATLPDPRRRVSGRNYQVPGGPREELVASDPRSALRDYDEVTVGGQAMRIYRFVSWRDEECPVISLRDLATTVQNLRTLLTTTTGTLDALVGPDGALTRSIADGTTLLGQLSPVAVLLQAVTNVVGLALKPIDLLLRPLQAPLEALLSRVNAVLAPLTSRVTDLLDLCDLPRGVLPDLSAISAVATVLGQLNPILGTIAPLVDDVADVLHSLLDLNVFGLLSAVVKAPVILVKQAALLVQLPRLSSLLSSVVDTAGNPTTLVALATGLTSSLGDLVGFLAAPNTTHNTKRISVAVVVVPKGGGHVTPRAPIWVSSVVTDPSDGIL